MTHHILKLSDGTYVDIAGRFVLDLEKARVYPSKRAASASLSQINKRWDHRGKPVSGQPVAVRLTVKLDTVTFKDMEQDRPYFWVHTGTELPDRTKFYYRKGDSLYNHEDCRCPVSPSDRFVP